jgi:diamine N-acetyltransferase
VQRMDLGNTSTIKLVPVSSRRDIEKVSAVAQAIWHEYFPAVIGAEEADYLVNKIQSPLAIAEQIGEGYEYLFITENNQVIGYTAFRVGSDDLYLSKLYLVKELRGGHRSSQVLAYLVDFCRENALDSIYLNCNKDNSASLTVYEHWGFVRERAEKIPMGGGHYMDDYVYRLSVPKAKRPKDTSFPTRKHRGATEVTTESGTREVGQGAASSHPRRKFTLPENEHADYPWLAREYAADLEKLPRFSLAGFLLTPVWAPAHGFWIAILLYPAWVFVDSLIRQAVEQQTLLAIGLATLITAATVALSAWIAASAQKNAYLRIAGKRPLEAYLKRERLWNIISIPVALIVVALATYYNLVVYTSSVG